MSADEQKRSPGKQKGKKAKKVPSRSGQGLARFPHLREYAETTDDVRELVRPHVESFNYMLQDGGGLDNAVLNMDKEVLDATPDKGWPAMELWFDKVVVQKPSKKVSEDSGSDLSLYPSECRERGLSYSGQLMATVCRRILPDGPTQEMNIPLGELPIMLCSSRCHLEHLSRKELVEKHEEAGEWGGTFIVNGLERIMRLLIVPRRNHPFAITRPSFTNRGSNYTPHAVQIRCVRSSDQVSRTITLHYLSDGNCRIRFSLRKQEYFLPILLVLKALIPVNDEQIFSTLTLNDAATNSFVADRVEVMIREAKRTRLRTRTDILKYLGRYYRTPMRRPAAESDEAAGAKLLDEVLLIHCEAETQLKRNQKKFDMLVLLLRKLYALVNNEIKPDNPDALCCQEILLPGHLYLMQLTEKLQDYLKGAKAVIQKEMRMRPDKVDLNSEAFIKKCLKLSSDVGGRLHHFMTTGNLRSHSGLDLMQTSGFTIVADKLNYFRYLSHFRSVHRGQFFTEMKTTTVRKLLPESWGFMCPVHTPDGAPCGLLNHLAAKCHVLTHTVDLDEAAFRKLLHSLGMVDVEGAGHPWKKSDLPVLLDGVVVGRVSPSDAGHLISRLRYCKVLKHDVVPDMLEIASVLKPDGISFPGIYLATSPARMMRPVKHLEVEAAFPDRSAVEFVGAMEQVNMDIACQAADYVAGVTTHMEFSPTNMLSIIASMTPFSDHNQSPRNMYQCQMGKQTMAVPFHSIPYRVDNKVYAIQTPQTPIVRNELYEKYMMDEYPLGTNAIVAVISYTGYDMEDAMILNKSSVERGFAHASVYKTATTDLSEKAERMSATSHYGFTNFVETRDPDTGNLYNKRVVKSLDNDGLPRIGQKLTPQAPQYCVVNELTQRAEVKKMKESEDAVVQEVRLIGTNDHKLQKVSFKLRINRNPTIGDKFSSRHGQKGVLSRLWPQEDMPFTESGMVPDLLINPHAFPSRMTIGMLVESMAGKVGALQGRFQDSTPFKFSDAPGNRAVDHFGKALVESGYNYVGNEPMYSGNSGEEFQVEIFIGLVYYQRLRHMVSDKSQVRSTGPVDYVTRQPVQGRKRGGGIRFGEMERDSLLAHGTSFLLHDRLMTCSDYHTAPVCTRCGSLMSVQVMGRSSSDIHHSEGTASCRNCKTHSTVAKIAVPYVFIYLANELAAMNIRMTLNVETM